MFPLQWSTLDKGLSERKKLNALVAKSCKLEQGEGEPDVRMGSLQQISAMIEVFSSKKNEEKDQLYVEALINSRTTDRCLTREHHTTS